MICSQSNVFFRSDFSLVKLCDFGSVRSAGDIVIKKVPIFDKCHHHHLEYLKFISQNELLPYCPAELVARHANEYYQVTSTIIIVFIVLNIFAF